MGSTVRVLGIPIGTVDAVEPVGTQVRATLSLDSDQPIPADASAV
ncbi:MlaD family protein, partial [Kibdelosporangium lantanae]